MSSAPTVYRSYRNTVPDLPTARRLWVAAALIAGTQARGADRSAYLSDHLYCGTILSRSGVLATFMVRRSAHRPGGSSGGCIR